MFEKPKKNKSQIIENVSNDVLRNPKLNNVKSNKDEDINGVQEKEIIEEKEKQDSVKEDMKERESNSLNDMITKSNTKEAKTKKNKAETRHRNSGKGKYAGKGVRGNVAPTDKESVPEQGNQESTCPILPPSGSLASEVAKARQYIKQSLQCMDGVVALAAQTNEGAGACGASINEENNSSYMGCGEKYSWISGVVEELKTVIATMEKRINILDEQVARCCCMIGDCPPKPTSVPQPQPEKKEDDDIDLFGSDSEGEDAEDAKIREERLAAYAAKKSKKPAIIAKSNIILDVKPWDDETNMKEMEEEVRKIKTDGLLWGAAKLVPLAFGIHKLQISCVVEDDKVSVDWLTEKIQESEEYVQSVDIAAFNKV
ncbi:hypothetical protein KM043_017019 [Ampulex compressa]|nr:hypothetical protein KM043_017019 [Ampulex compressa]